ncbi:unnamed protein product [Closterium sp. NIES-65]|nr:unnamed protein product [Closterium sp. NIES-65]
MHGRALDGGHRRSPEQRSKLEQLGAADVKGRRGAGGALGKQRLADGKLSRECVVIRSAVTRSSYPAPAARAPVVAGIHAESTFTTVVAAAAM